MQNTYRNRKRRPLCQLSCAGWLFDGTNTVTWIYEKRIQVHILRKNLGHFPWAIARRLHDAMLAIVPTSRWYTTLIDCLVLHLRIADYRQGLKRDWAREMQLWKQVCCLPKHVKINHLTPYILISTFSHPILLHCRLVELFY